MNLLLDDRLAPITSEIGFLQASVEQVVEAYLGWQGPIQKEQGVDLMTDGVDGTLEEVLGTLLPLTSVERRRFLFVPTTSDWVAFFDNGHQGTDAMPAMSYLAQEIACNGLRVGAVPDTVQGKSRTAKGRYGATILEFYGPDQTEFLNFIRTIAAVHDGDRWVFEAFGTPLSFEDESYYKARRKKDRFTLDMLDEYLRKMGLSVFDESFYKIGARNRAVRIEKVGPKAPNLVEYSLKEARAHFL